MLSSLQLLALSCFALPEALWLLCVLRGLKEGHCHWPRLLLLPRGSPINAPEVEQPLTGMPRSPLASGEYS